MSAMVKARLFCAEAVRHVASKHTVKQLILFLFVISAFFYLCLFVSAVPPCLKPRTQYPHHGLRPWSHCIWACWRSPCRVPRLRPRNSRFHRGSSSHSSAHKPHGSL